MNKYDKKFLERFWSKVSKGGPDECWNWLAWCDSGGYGSISTTNGYTSAHRVSWELHKGPIPKGMHVLHSCDNPPCINPLHLFLGTQMDNMKDCIAKGRMPRGEDKVNAKLTEQNVLEIRVSNETQAVLAKRYGVSCCVVSMTKRHLIWRHVE